jgi:protein-disulfide isomerase-like protein with CxxC motif
LNGASLYWKLPILSLPGKKDPLTRNIAHKKGASFGQTYFESLLQNSATDNQGGCKVKVLKAQNTPWEHSKLIILLMI